MPKELKKLNKIMSKYKLQNNDSKYALEFRNNLKKNNYFHSPSLQRILNLFRSGPKKGKYVLIKSQGKKKWFLGQLPASRGQKIKINKAVSFNNLIDAEWYVFKKRWKYHSGKNLGIK